MGQEINQVIDNICDKLGILANQLIPEMAKMKIAEEGVCTGASVLATIIGIVLLAVGSRLEKKGDNDVCFTFFIAGMFGCIFGVIGIFLFLPDLVGWVASPTAKTFEYIAESL